MNKHSSSLRMISLVLVAALICSVVFNVVFVGIVGTAHAAAGIENVATRQEDYAPDTNVTATFNPADIDIDQLTLKYIDQEVVQKNIAAYDGERWVIVELDGTTLYDEYERQHSFESFTDYVASPDAKRVMTSINAAHWAFLDKLDRHGISYEYKYSYSTINNGVAIKINAEAYNAVKQMAGVSGVYLSESYAAPKAVENNANVYTTGIYKSDDIVDAAGNRYQGEGMVVAILDTGLDRTHEAFQHMPTDMSKAAMNRDYIEGIIESGSNGYRLNAVGTADDLYYSDKVPFAYDYADDDANVFPSYSSHGTHVAGIVAGKSDYVVNADTGETFIGVAPEAQLVICKVFTDMLESEMLGGADDIDILAAISDCVTLGVDIINMSLGTSAGFSDEPSNQHLTEVYNRVWEAGISLVVAASNDYSSGYGGGNGTNLLTNPDSGTVGSPSTYGSALSVASINGQKAEYIIANGDPEQVAFITNASDINGNEVEWVEKMFETYGKEGKEELKLKYVVIGGVGRQGNYTAVKRLFHDSNYDATIALVKRGTTTFQEKVQAAQANGADACIIYNNVSGTIRMSIGDILNPIPTCSITMDAGKVFVDNAVGSVGTITVRRDFLAGPFMSEFSSWGPTPDLKLKPEITAHGGEITSAVAGGYDVYSGTSMAAPNMAGATALLRQYLKGVMFPSEQRLTAEQNRQLNARVNQTLMSTATIARNEDNNPYSPRKQGAGLASIKNAVKTEAYITVPLKGAEGVSDKAKIELGDDPEKKGVYEFSFIVNNISSAAQVYNPITYVMTETIASDGRTVAEKAYMLQDMCKITYKVNGAEVQSINVEAGQTATVNVRIELLAAAKAYLAKFANGMYVEGFVSLANSNSEAVTIGLPFLAFYGDWTDSPLFDYDTYELAESDRTETLEENKLKASAAETRVLGLYYDDQYILPLGQYIYKQDELTQQKMYPDRQKAAISMYDNYLYESIPLTEGRHTVYELYMVYAGLLRNAAFIDLQITDAATGELVYGKVIADQGKSYAAGGSNRGSGIMLELNPYEWGMTNNSTYNVRLVGQLDMVHEEDYVDYDIKYEMEYAPGTSESQKTQANRIYEFYGNSFKNLKDPALIIGKTYYFKETASDGSTLYPAKDRSSFDFQFTVDYEDPQLLDYNLRFEPIKDGNKVTYSIYLDLFVYDNQYVQAVLPCYLKEDRALGTNVLTLLTEYPIPVEASSPGETTKITLDVTDYYESYIKTGNLYISILDYALNHFAANLVIREGTITYPEAKEGVWFAQDDKLTYSKYTNTGAAGSGEGYPSYNLTIAPYELYKLTLDASMDGTRVDLPSLYWAGSSSYVKVKDDEIYAYGGRPGSKTTLTLRQGESANSKIYATVTVTIGEDAGNSLPSPSRLTFKSTLNGNDYLNDMSSAAPQVEMYPYQSLSLEVEITPWYLNAKYLPVDIANQITYEWTISGETYIDMPVKTGNPVTVNTLQQGSGSVAVTVAKVGGRSVKKTVSISIKSEFDAENYTLYNFYGGETCKIPDHLNVMYIDEDCFKNNKTVKHVVLPASLTEIPKNCFSGCENLEDITINGKCIVVGINAFLGCKNLRTVTLDTFVDSNQKPLPEKYKGSLAIGANAFKGCVNLQTIENPQRITTIYDEAFMGCTSLREIDITALRVVGANVFSGCTGLQTVTHSAATVIGKGMFEGCTSLTSFDFTGTRIPDNAFLNCTTLANVTFAEGLLSIGQNAFGGDIALGSISLPNGKIEIASSAFTGCSTLSKVELGSATELVFANGTPFTNCKQFTQYTIKGGTSEIYTVKDGVLYSEDGKKLISVPVGKACGTQEQVNAILNGVDTIGRTAFAGNLSLTEIVLIKGDASSATAYNLEPYAFAGATKLTKVTLSKFSASIANIPEGLFMNASSLQDATGSMSVTHIGTRAFSGTRINASFTSVVEIGDYAFYGANLSGALTFGSLTKIGAYAFASCANIRTISATSATEVGDCAFANITSLTTLTLGPVTKMGNGILSGSTAAISTVTFGEGTTYIGRSVFGQGASMVEAFLNEVGSPGISKTVTINIPDSVTAIGAYAFTGLLNLTSVNLAGVKQIGDYAFMRSGVAQLLKTAPTDDVYTLANVEYIGKYAFNGTKVTKLSLPKAYDIGAMAFMDCENLTSIVFGYSDTDDGHDFKVGNFAFYGSGLTEVTLPSALVSRYYVYDWNMYDLKNRIEETKYRFENALADGAFAGVEKLTAIHVSGDGDVFFEQEGVLYSRVADGLVLEQYPAGKPGEEFTVPEGVVAIAASAFEGSQNLKKVILPSSLKVIGNAAFFHTKAADMQYVFKSVQAPTLVADFDMYMSDQADALLTEYYCNFYGYSIKASPTIFVVPQYFSMSAVVPVNGKGYDTPLWQHFFTNLVEGETVVKIAYTGEVAVATETTAAIDKIDAFKAAYEAMDDGITVEQFFAAGGINEIAKAARTSYNRLSDSVQIELASEAYAELERIESELRTFKREKFGMVINTKVGRDAITVISSPSKLQYNAGDRFSCAGMVVRLNYDDGSSVIVTAADITTDNKPIDSEYATVYVVDDMGNRIAREIAIDVAGLDGGGESGDSGEQGGASQKAGLGAGAIAGIAIAAIAVVAIAACIAAVAIVKRRKKAASVEAKPEEAQNGGADNDERTTEMLEEIQDEGDVQADAEAVKGEQDGEEE